jgi:hypothetical protein
MSALVWEEIPFRLASRYLHLVEPHQFESKKGKIGWILMGSALERLGSGIPIPLFAGDLASSAGGTFRRIYEKGFICHLSHLLNSLSFFWLA